MTAISIPVEYAAVTALSGTRFFRRFVVLMRFRNYPGQRRRRAKAALRWLADYTRHQR